MSELTNPISANRVISTPLVTKDGKIDATNQGTKGDCWFLSAVNALSSTDKGQEIISNILEYHNKGNSSNGYTVVHLAMGDFKITDREVANIKNSAASSKFASGDDDMIILELAAEKAINSSGDKFAYDVNTPSYVEDLMSNSDKSSMESGDFEKAIYMLTGNAATIYKPDVVIKDGNAVFGKDGINQAIEIYTANPSNNKAMNASIKQGKGTSLQDIQTGEKIDFKDNHQYSVKNISNNMVTLINPSNSAVELNISLNDFKNTFTQIEYIDLDEQNNKRNYVSQEYTTNGKEKNFTFNYEDGTSSTKTYKNGKLTSVSSFDANNQLTSALFYKNGKAVNEVQYNSDNTKNIYIYDKSGKNKVRCVNVNEGGNITTVSRFNSQTSQWEKSKVNFDDIMALGKLNKNSKNDLFHIKNNGSCSHVLSKLDVNGQKDQSSSVVLSNTEYERLNNSLLLQKSNLSPSQIKSLLNLNI